MIFYLLTKEEVNEQNIDLLILGALQQENLYKYFPIKQRILLSF